MKEHTTLAVISMLRRNHEAVFQNEDSIRIAHDGFSIVYAGIRNVPALSDKFLNYKWTEVQQSVPVIKALKAYESGKTIYCIVKDLKYMYFAIEENECTNGLSGRTLRDSTGQAITTDELLNGKWFIEVENEE